MKGVNEERQLYNACLQVLDTFYGKALFGGNANEGKLFLTLFLEAARKTPGLVLEKISFNTPELQRLYYTMLKGTKKHDIANNLGLPPLSDFFKIDPSPEKICSRHAHPDLFAALFSPSRAKAFFLEIHKENPESIERICIKLQVPSLYLDLFAEANTPCVQTNTAFLGEDTETGIFLKRTLKPTPSNL